VEKRTFLPPTGDELIWTEFKCFWWWHALKTVASIVNIVHGLGFLLKHNFSKTGFCFCSGIICFLGKGSTVMILHMKLDAFDESGVSLT
jgi:hypothetical protein